MNLDTSIRDILEAQKLLPLLPPVLVPPHPEAATSGTIQFQPNWRGDASLTPAEQAVKKQRNDAATLYWATQKVENAGRAEREAAAAKAREQEEAEWVKLSTREHTKKPKRTNEGVFDIFSKKQRVINALITRRTAERDAADTQSDQLGLSMNTYLNHRDDSRRADDRIEKLKLRKKGERGRDYTDGMNAGALEWFKKEKKQDNKKKKQGKKQKKKYGDPYAIPKMKKYGNPYTNEETLHELDKSTVQSFIRGREQQAEIAAAHSQTAKKAWLGNSRKTGWRDGVVPRVVGQIGKIGQHDDALLRTAGIFDKRSEKAKASADKAKLRLSGKRANTMQNEEYTQVLEQMILTLTGMKLEELHEAVGGHLSEDWETADHWKETNKKNKTAALAVMKKKYPHLDPMAGDGFSRLYHQYIPDKLVKAQSRELSSNTVYDTGSKPVPAPTTLAGMKKLHPKLRGDDPFTKTTFVPKPGGKLGTKNTFRMPKY